MTSEELIKVSVESFIKEYIKEAKQLFGDLYDNGKQFLEVGLKRYLTKHKERYSKIKTLLHGNTPIYLYDIYYHLKLFIDKTSYYKTESVSNIFTKEKKCITIIGDAG